jgi:hypothetical protein
MKTLVSLAAVLSFGFATSGSAADFDGSRPLLCAPFDVAECLIGPECAPVTLEDANVPNFIKVDFKGKKLSGRMPSGENETTAIQNVRSVQGETVLQGAETGRAWSIVIDQDTGQMMASVTGFTPEEKRLGFILFGACTADF